MAIGIYDSGVGGLSIWRELQVRLKTRLIYFGDTAHVPYGEKGADELEGYFWNIMNFFSQQGVCRCGCGVQHYEHPRFAPGER